MTRWLGASLMGGGFPGRRVMTMEPLSQSCTQSFPYLYKGKLCKVSFILLFIVSF